jgi:hypothetical protein
MNDFARIRSVFMFLPGRAISIFSCVSAVLMLATGCNLSPASENSSGGGPLPLISGRVHGGQQPVSGATIQMYAANTTTTQGASTAMLTQTVTTDSNGNFSISGLYTCPASDPLVYIVATGGNPGLSGNVNNSSIALMAPLGSCNNLTSNTYIVINELTTVASVQAFAPFMTDYAHIGSAPSSISGVGGAFVSASGEVNFSTGEFEGGANYVVLPFVTLNTLADILSACVNTSSSSSSACTTLFSNTGGATNTIAADLQMAEAPGQNTGPLYGLVTATSPFQPYFTSVPSDFTSTVGYVLPSYVQAGTLDSNGQIWLYYGGYNYNTATDTSTDSPGYIAVYDNNFNQLFTVNPGTGGMYYPTGLTPDASGHVFAINSNNTISEFASNGAALSPAAGWPTGLSSTFSPSGSGNNYVSNDSQGGPIQVDAAGNIWGGTPYFYSAPSNCYFEMNSSGTVITPTGTFCSVTGITYVDTAALDGAGNAWALGETTIAKVNAQGNLAATAPNSQGCFYPRSNATTTVSEESVTNNLLYDHAHGQVWGYSETGAGTITDAAAAVFCDYGSITLPVLPQYASTTTTVGSAFSGGSILITSAALDGAGNLWFVTGGIAETGVVASSTGTTVATFTGTAKYSSYLGEVSSSGALLSPYNASTQTYGLQPTGFGSNVSASATNASISVEGATVGLLGIDRFGNIWAIDEETYKLLKITGLAAANTVNY